MRILITGSDGFIGKNLKYNLLAKGYSEIFECDKNTPYERLADYCEKCDYVFHLAGVNRPKNNKEYMIGNGEFTEKISSLLAKTSKAPIVFSSSTQAELDNDYGNSKRYAEKVLSEYSSLCKVPVYIFRLPNVFGKWCKPNYNSVIATFCYNAANDLPIYVDDPGKVLTLVYIDDVISDFIKCIENVNFTQRVCYLEPSVAYKRRLGEISKLILSFKNKSDSIDIPEQSDEFTKKLYSTYISYLSSSQLSQSLNTHSDNRGSFTEFIRTANSGQVSVNISKPGITKGNHWHNTKHEVFLVVQGSGIIRLRRLDQHDITEIAVDGSELKPVIIPPGYTHNIENIGNVDMITLIWANEKYDKDDPDTYYLNV